MCACALAPDDKREECLKPRELRFRDRTDELPERLLDLHFGLATGFAFDLGNPQQPYRPMHGDDVAVAFWDWKGLSEMSAPFTRPVADENPEMRQLSHKPRSLREHLSVPRLGFGRLTGRPRTTFLRGIDVDEDRPAVGWATVTLNKTKLDEWLNHLGPSRRTPAPWVLSPSAAPLTEPFRHRRYWPPIPT